LNKTLCGIDKIKVPYLTEIQLHKLRTIAGQKHEIKQNHISYVCSQKVTIR